MFTWTIEPLRLGALAGLLGLYALGQGPLRRRLRPGQPLERGRAAAFLVGWCLFALVLISPLDALGRTALFAAHTAQAFILITAVAPLLLAGLPEWLVAWLLPLEAWRRATRGLLFPVAALLGFNTILLGWHVPALYEAALRDPVLHLVQMFSFVLAGALTWWPLLTPLDRHTRLARPFQIFYLAAESLPLDIFGISLLFAPNALYPTYAAAPRVWDLGVLADQQVAGAILAIPGNLVDVVFMSMIFFAWIAQVEQRQQASERAEAATAQARESSAP